MSTGAEDFGSLKHPDIGAKITSIFDLSSEALGELMAYIAQNPPPIPISQIVGFTQSAEPPGAIKMYGGASAPTGYLLCDGTAVSRTNYVTLFGIIGTIYGVGDGATTFNLPDLRGRMPVGKGTHADVDALGDNDGIATVANRRPAHKHTTTIGTLAASAGTLATGDDTPDHTHSFTTKDTIGGLSVGAGQGATINATFPTSGASARHTHPITGSPSVSGVPTVGPQTGAEPVDSSAYLALNFIIKT